jgi:hypothetical protein
MIDKDNKINSLKASNRKGQEIHQLLAKTLKAGNLNRELVNRAQWLVKIHRPGHHSSHSKELANRAQWLVKIHRLGHHNSHRRLVVNNLCSVKTLKLILHSLWLSSQGLVKIRKPGRHNPLHRSQCLAKIQRLGHHSL